MNHIQHCYTHLGRLCTAQFQGTAFMLQSMECHIHVCHMWQLWLLFVMTTFLLLLSYWSIVDLQCHVSFWCTAKWFNDLVMSVCEYIYTHTHTYTHLLFSLWFITEYWIVSYANIYANILFSLWFIIEYEIQFSVQ